jgi:hypothetical protein
MYSNGVELICKENKKIQFELDPKPGVILQANYPDACKYCSNSPANGGSGICHCTLGSYKITAASPLQLDN